MEAECAKVFQAEKGTRNETLNRSAFNVFRLVAGGEISEADAQTELEVAASSCGLGAKEIKATISSAQSEAFKSPKSASTIPTQGAGQENALQVKSGGLPEPPLEVFPARIRQMLEQAAVAFKYLPPEVP